MPQPARRRVLAGLGLLDDDTVPRSGPGSTAAPASCRRASPTAVRDWLLVLLDGDARSRPRSATTIYVYFTAVQPLIDRWSASRGHLREVTADDIRAGLDNFAGTRSAPRSRRSGRCSGSPGSAGWSSPTPPSG